jgi:hypothetical protein
MRAFLPFVCIGAFLFSSSSVFAQKKKDYNRNNTVYQDVNHYGKGSQVQSLKLALGGGAVSYSGELGNYGDKIRPMVNVGILYKIIPNLSLRGDFSYFTLTGDDKGGNNDFRNLSFRSRNIEAFGGVMYELFDVDNYSRGQALIVNPYIFAGLGVTNVNPTTVLDGNRYKLRDFQTEDVKYAGSTPVIPLGLGVRLEVTRMIGFSLEATYRFTFTDYLDDVSTNYVVLNDPLRARLADRGPEVGTPAAEPGQQRGNPASNDGYLSLGARVEFLLFPSPVSNKPQCPGRVRRRGVRN